MLQEWLGNSHSYIGFLIEFFPVGCGEVPSRTSLRLTSTSQAPHKHQFEQTLHCFASCEYYISSKRPTENRAFHWYRRLPHQWAHHIIPGQWILIDVEEKWYPLVIEPGNWKSYTNRGLNGKNIDKFGIVQQSHVDVSENSVSLNPMVLLIIIPMKNGYFIGNINPTFSDKPMFDDQRFTAVWVSFFRSNWVRRRQMSPYWANGVPETSDVDAGITRGQGPRLLETAVKIRPKGTKPGQRMWGQKPLWAQMRVIALSHNGNNLDVSLSFQSSSLRQRLRELALVTPNSCHEAHEETILGADSAGFWRSVGRISCPWILGSHLQVQVAEMRICSALRRLPQPTSRSGPRCSHGCSAAKWPIYCHICHVTMQ